MDGLIHISQIADRRIEKPGDVLTEGEIVEAKITAVDEEKKKISLSMRALLAPENRVVRFPISELPPQGWWFQNIVLLYRTFPACG